MHRLSVAIFRRCLWGVTLLIAFHISLARGAEPALPRELLTQEEWRRLDKSVDAGLRFLATQQQSNGSFAAPELGQPAITSLCVLSFLSRGHLPGEGEYGEVLDRAIEFVLKSQQPDGLLYRLPIKGRSWGDNRHKAGAYNHGIAGVMLAEVYGMKRGEKSEASGMRSARRSSSRLVGNSSGSRFRTIRADGGTWCRPAGTNRTCP